MYERFREQVVEDIHILTAGQDATHSGREWSAYQDAKDFLSVALKLSILADKGIPFEVFFKGGQLCFREKEG